MKRKLQGKEKEGGVKRGAILAFHSHPIAHRGESAGVLPRRKIHKPSMKQQWKLKPVHSRQAALSAPVSRGVRTAAATLSKAQLWDKPALGREQGK